MNRFLAFWGFFLLLTAVVQAADQALLNPTQKQIRINQILADKLNQPKFDKDFEYKVLRALKSDTDRQYWQKLTVHWSKTGRSLHLKTFLDNFYVSRGKSSISRIRIKKVGQQYQVTINGRKTFAIDPANIYASLNRKKTISSSQNPFYQLFSFEEAIADDSVFPNENRTMFVITAGEVSFEDGKLGTSMLPGNPIERDSSININMGRTPVPRDSFFSIYGQKKALGKSTNLTCSDQFSGDINGQKFTLQKNGKSHTLTFVDSKASFQITDNVDDLTSAQLQPLKDICAKGGDFGYQEALKQTNNDDLGGPADPTATQYQQNLSRLINIHLVLHAYPHGLPAGTDATACARNIAAQQLTGGNADPASIAFPTIITKCQGIDCDKIVGGKGVADEDSQQYDTTSVFGTKVAQAISYVDDLANCCDPSNSQCRTDLFNTDKIKLTPDTSGAQ